MNQLEQSILQTNVDVRLSQQKINQSEAVTRGVRGAFYPVLSMKTIYSDDKKRPTNGLQPSRAENTHIEASLLESTPWGIDFSVGVQADKLKLYGTEIPNPALPYPATFLQPAAFLKIEIDLLQDFLGSTTLKTWDRALATEKIVKGSLRVIKHRVAVSAQSLFVQLGLLRKTKGLLMQLIGKQEGLQADVRVKIANRIAEKGDLYKLQASISNLKANLASLGRRANELSGILQSVSHLPQGTYFNPRFSIRTAESKIQKCESKIIALKGIEASWSSEYALIENSIRKSRLDKQILVRKGLADIKFFGAYGPTGNQVDLDDAKEEFANGLNSQLNLGLTLTYPLSGSIRRSINSIGTAGVMTERLKLHKLMSENMSFFTKVKRTSKNLRGESSLYRDSIRYGGKGILDLKNRYDQGRVPLYQLIQEEAVVLQSEIKLHNLLMERSSLIFNFLSRFDGFNCDVTNL